jgi:hypothetical protein
VTRLNEHGLFGQELHHTRHPALLLLAIGVALGVGVWLLSPWLTGRAEPWDADAPIWPTSWLLMAIAAGGTGRLHGLLLVVGYALGQMLVTVKSVLGSEFGALGWLFILGWMAAALVASLALVAARALLGRFWRSRP